MGAAPTGETAAAVAGGGALGSADAVKTLADAGITVISSTHARGVLPDSHRASLRAFHNSPSVEALIAQCDFTLVAGSRLRSNETVHGRLSCLPRGCRSISTRRQQAVTT